MENSLMVRLDLEIEAMRVCVNRFITDHNAEISARVANALRSALNTETVSRAVDDVVAREVKKQMNDAIESELRYGESRNILRAAIAEAVRKAANSMTED